MFGKSIRIILLALLCGLTLALFVACGDNAAPVPAPEPVQEPVVQEPAQESAQESAPEPEPVPAPQSLTEPQEFFGEIPFEHAENVEIRFYLTADLKQINKIDFSVGSLRLTPKNSGSGIESVVISEASMTRDSESAVTEGQTVSDSFFVYDLTVTPACIYGMIHIETEQQGEIMESRPTYMVIPNVTTPGDIPAEIQEKSF